jgi:hypothetical protein
MHSAKRNAAAEAHGVSETDQLGGKVIRENSLTCRPVQGRSGGRQPRAKGDDIKWEILSGHAAVRIKAERYPLSSGSRFRGTFGTDEWLGEGKSRYPDGGSLLRCHDEVIIASRTHHGPDLSRVLA